MFARCRLDPFNTAGGAGIPDPSNIRRIIVDHRAVADFVIGASGTLVLKTMPALPCPLFFHSGTAASGVQVSLNGVGYNEGGLGIIYSSNWIPAMLFSEWTTWAAGTFTGAPPPNILDPFTASRARIVTQAFRIYYTGQANNCAGIINVTRDTISADEVPSLTNTAVSGYTYSGSTGTVYTISAGQAFSYRLTSGTTPTTILPDTVMTRPEGGCNILVQHTSPTYNWIPIREYGPVPQSAASPGNLWAADNTNIGVSSDFALLDQGWDSVNIYITGATSGTGFRVECVTCVEYEPTPASTVARFAKPQNATNPNVVAAVDAVAKTIPVSMPLASSLAPWLRTAFRAIAVAAPGAGLAIGGPLGGAIGGLVGSIAGGFS